MPSSINGWPVLDGWSDPRLVTKTVPGTTRRLALRDVAAPLLLALAADYHHAVAPIDQGAFDDWSFDRRPARAADDWSNHASATAMDLNSSKEGAQGTAVFAWWQQFNRAAKARRIRRRYRIVNWGAWSGIADDPHTPETEGWSMGGSDPMHWELKKGTTVADVQREIARLRIDGNGIRRRRDGSPVHPAA